MNILTYEHDGFIVVYHLSIVTKSTIVVTLLLKLYSAIVIRILSLK